MSDVRDLRGKTDEELRKELDGVVQGLFKLRFKKVTDVVENPAAFKQHRKDIARIKTLLREREIAKEKAEKEAAAKAKTAAAKPKTQPEQTAGKK